MPKDFFGGSKPILHSKKATESMAKSDHMINEFLIINKLIEEIAFHAFSLVGDNLEDKHASDIQAVSKLLATALDNVRSAALFENVDVNKASFIQDNLPIISQHLKSYFEHLKLSLDNIERLLSAEAREENLASIQEDEGRRDALEQINEKLPELNKRSEKLIEYLQAKSGELKKAQTIQPKSTAKQAHGVNLIKLKIGILDQLSKMLKYLLVKAKTIMNHIHDIRQAMEHNKHTKLK